MFKWRFNHQFYIHFSHGNKLSQMGGEGVSVALFSITAIFPPPGTPFHWVLLSSSVITL